MGYENLKHMVWSVGAQPKRYGGSSSRLHLDRHPLWRAHSLDFNYSDLFLLLLRGHLPHSILMQADNICY